MICQEALQLLYPYSDGELDLVRHVQIEQHLNECAKCAEQEKHLRSLRTAISSPSLYHKAPSSLRRRIQSAIPPVTRGRRRPSMQLAAIAAGLLFLVATSATVGMFFSGVGRSADDRLVEWVLADHIRSVQVDHLTDVVSSDRHTVKPWFQGKLDFAFQVPDLSGHGYILSGGRLDYLADRPVAALVYFRRLHAINVFIWPAIDDKERAVHGLTRQGFHIRDWQQSGMNYWAISDLNDQELDEFVQLFQGF